MSTRKYSNEFKEEAVRLMLEDGLSATEVADKLGINRDRLYDWRIKFGKEVSTGKNMRDFSPEYGKRNS